MSMFVIGTGGYILGTKNIVLHTYQPKESLPQNKQGDIVSPTLEPDLTSSGSGFIKRNFDPSAMYPGNDQLHTSAVKYPDTFAAPLIGTPEANLIGFYCSPQYTYDENKYYDYDVSRGTELQIRLSLESWKGCTC